MPLPGKQGEDTRIAGVCLTATEVPAKVESATIGAPDTRIGKKFGRTGPSS